MPIFSRMAASWISLSFLYLVLALSSLKCNISYHNNERCSKLNATKQVHGVWQSQHVNHLLWRCLMLLHLASPLISSHTVRCVTCSVDPSWWRSVSERTWYVWVSCTSLLYVGQNVCLSMIPVSKVNASAYSTLLRCKATSHSQLFRYTYSSRHVHHGLGVLDGELTGIE